MKEYSICWGTRRSSCKSGNTRMEKSKSSTCTKSWSRALGTPWPRSIGENSEDTSHLPSKTIIPRDLMFSSKFRSSRSFRETSSSPFIPLSPWEIWLALRDWIERPRNWKKDPISIGLCWHSPQWWRNWTRKRASSGSERANWPESWSQSWWGTRAR